MNGPAAMLRSSSLRWPEKTALITGGRSLTYAELDDLSDRVAATLVHLGIGVGDRVSLYATNRWEWVVAYHGILKASAVVNPINVMLTANEVRYVLADCAAAALIASDEKLTGLAGLLDEVPSLRAVISLDEPVNATHTFDDLVSEPARLGSVPPPAGGREPSTIGYTSGTTGHPKGAVQSHEAVLLNCRSTAEMHARSSDDIMVTALPAPHVYGNVAINSVLLTGGTVVLMERFDAGQALSLIDEHRATLFEGVPAMYSMMLSHSAFDRADLTSLRRSTVGGQTIGHSTVRAWEEKTAAPMLELWGMTELAGLGTTHWADQPTVSGSIGVALPGLELRVADFDDHTVSMSPGQPGELMARGPHVMLGYFNNPDATAEAIEADGWLHTGDVATSDESGHYFIVDRRKDMILTAGYNVYPAEIERVLAGHPDVAMVAVGATPDEIKGELARAYIVRRPGSTPSEADIIAFARDQLAAYKVPRSVTFVDALPQTSTGKVMRRKLYELNDKP